jgi:transglutaminase-like putative cysteine protease
MAIKKLLNQNILALLLLIIILIACQPVTISKDGVSEMQSDGSSQTIDEQTSASNDNNDQELLNPSLNILDSVEYRLQQNIKLVNHGPGSPSKQNLWVALISDDAPYQEVLEREISPSSYQIVIDEYGNEIAEFDFSEMLPDSEIQVSIDYRVKVNQVAADLSTCFGELPDFYTDAELHIESENPQIISLSRELAKDYQSICEQVRAFYNYIGQELVYSYNGGNWGAQAALGEMGADCTEYSSLMIALSRAAGIPARYIEGLSFTPEGDEALARQEHAWLEVFLPSIGWTPMDPTMGRSPLNRDSYFGKLPAGHIIVSRGRNPSTLRGASYWTYIYWPGSSAEIKIEQGDWAITQLEQ